MAKFEWFTDLVPEHLKRWGVSWKKIRMDRPEEYVGEFDFRLDFRSNFRSDFRFVIYYLAIRDRIGRRLLEEAQEFLPELQFFDHVDYIKGIFWYFSYVNVTFKKLN